MKKIIAYITIVTCLVSALSAQLMDKNQYTNSLWTGFGNFNPRTDPADAAPNARDFHTDHAEWKGFSDVFQARMSAGTMTIDAMLQWNANTYYDSDDSLDHVAFEYQDSEVNFILKAVKNLDFGMGTRLNWLVGPAPSNGGYLWQVRYHVMQGGLQYGLPGAAAVTGAAYYANYINNNYKLKTNTVSTEAVALNVNYEDLFQVMGAVPNGSSTDDFVVNGGLRVMPTESILIAAAFNRILLDDGNLYAGLSCTVIDNIQIDGWFAMNNLGGKSDNGLIGTGGALGMNLGEFTLRPEIGVTFYESSHYTTAGYTGLQFIYDLTEELSFNLWSSVALGSKDKRWDSSRKGGTIIDIRPDLTYFFKTNDEFAVSFEYQRITSFLDKTYNNWSMGFFWTHIF